MQRVLLARERRGVLQRLVLDPLVVITDVTISMLCADDMQPQILATSSLHGCLCEDVDVGNVL